MEFPAVSEHKAVIGYGYWNNFLSLDGVTFRFKAEIPYDEYDDQGNLCFAGWGIRMCLGISADSLSGVKTGSASTCGLTPKTKQNKA